MSSAPSTWTTTSTSTPAPLINRVLLTNDDGIDAPGLRALEAVASKLAREVWVFAPETDQSGTSHSVSLHSPLRVIPRGERRFGVTGTPGDCVVLACQLMGEAPDLVLSGINRGGNLGVETVFSGTVGAAMTGTLMGIPSIAMSQVYSGKERVRWETGEALAPEVLRRVLATTWGEGVCLNINFPDVDASDAGPMRVTRQGKGLVRGMFADQKLDPRNQHYYWLRFKRDGEDPVEDSEAAVVRGGAVSVTPLRFERTDPDALDQLRAALA